MKEKRQTQNVYSGVKITDNISLTIPKRKVLPDFLPLIIIAFIGCTGIINAFISMFQIEFSHTSLNFYTIFFFSLFSVIFILPKKFMISLLPIFFTYEFLLYRNWNSYINGFMIVYNQVYRVIWPRRSDYFKLDISEMNVAANTTVFIGFTIFILIAIICYFTVVKPNFLFGFLFTFPLIEIGFYYGKSPSLLPAFMVIIYWASLLSVHQSGYYRNLGRSKTGFIRRGNKFTAKPIIKFRTAGQTGIIMLTGSMAIMTAAFIFLNLSGYSRSEKLDTMRYNVKAAVSEFTFNDLGGSLERLSASFGIGNLKMYDHRLGNKPSVSYNGSTDLTVTCEIPLELRGNIYLKGYVGSVYDGKSWDEFDDEIYKKSNNIFEVTRQYPQDMLYNSYGKNMSLISSLSQTSFDMTIQPSFLNMKYNYTPYNSVPYGDITYINDALTEMNDKKKYSFDVSIYQNFDTIFSESSYFTTEYSEEYHDFVYENYLNVPNNEDTEMLYDMFIDGSPYYNDIYSQLQNIKNILAENAEYTLEPGRTPNGRDFVSYFLTENHKGYCVHFATAGIILARMSGIPARYAEGYVVLREDFNEDNLTDNGYKIEIKDNRAHAWAEIYIDGYGWVPYEFTPSSAAALESNTEASTEIRTTTQRNSSSHITNTAASGSKKTSTKQSSTTVKRIDNSANSLKNEGSVNKAKMPNLSPEVKLTFSAIIIVFIIIAAVSAVHWIVTKKRQNGFITESNSQNALNAYNYILKLLEFCNIKNENMQYFEFSKYAERKSKHLFKNGEFTEITEIALEARLSGHEISAEQADKVIKLAHKTSMSIFRKKNIFERFYMKFIRNLC